MRWACFVFWSKSPLEIQFPRAPIEGSHKIPFWALSFHPSIYLSGRVCESNILSSLKRGIPFPGRKEQATAWLDVVVLLLCWEHCNLQTGFCRFNWNRGKVGESTTVYHGLCNVIFLWWMTFPRNIELAIHNFPSNLNERRQVSRCGYIYATQSYLCRYGCSKQQQQQEHHCPQQTCPHTNIYY